MMSLLDIVLRNENEKPPHPTVSITPRGDGWDVEVNGLVAHFNCSQTAYTVYDAYCIAARDYGDHS